MTSAYKDHLGRPLIAVTGMGVITSLGQGVEDNWKALTSGVSVVVSTPYRRIKPRRNEPVTLINRVPTGNVPPASRCERPPTR